MTKTIWKFPFDVKDDIEIEIPVGGQILDVQVQGRLPCLWVLVDPAAPKEVRRFSLAGTGHKIDDTTIGKHVGTFQMLGGQLVFHLFERA